MKLYKDELRVDPRLLRKVTRLGRLILSTKKDKVSGDKGLKEKYDRAVKKDLMILAIDGMEANADEVADLWDNVKRLRTSKSQEDSVEALKKALEV